VRTKLTEDARQRRGASPEKVRRSIRRSAMGGRSRTIHTVAPGCIRCWIASRNDAWYTANDHTPGKCHIIMANTFTSLHYHLVFSAKQREPWIRPEFQERVWAYLGGIVRDNEMKPLQIGGTEDHAHILLGMPPTWTVSEALRRIKGGSSGWIKANVPGCLSFAWQDGYGAFSVSKSHLPEVAEYIQNQREHHRVKTFKEEYRALLDRHGVVYDERRLWD